MLILVKALYPFKT